MQSDQTKLVELNSIKETVEDYAAIEKKIKTVFKKEIYIPLMRELGLNSKALQNAKWGLLEAIKSGRIQFSKGTFKGRFNSTTSKELKELGAQWDAKTGTFKLPQSSLSFEVKQAISLSESRFQEKLAAIDRRLGKIVPEEISSKIQITKDFDTALFKVERNFQKTIKGLTIAPELSAEQRRAISYDWQKNMDLWVQDFTKEEIIKLRSKIQKTAFSGNRYESAVKTIQKSYDVSANKAKFLARQETSLLMTKYKQTRYEDAGVYEYKWNCVSGSKNHPVRPRHKALADASKAGKIFKWDDPPVSSEPGEPARRNNPGQDYNCRCWAKPVIRVKKGDFAK